MATAPKATRQRRQRGSISADEIVRGAFEVAKGVSLDQLSMPNLAEYLDVGVTSIYWYFRKKNDLLNAMTDVAVDNYLGLMPTIASDEPWQDVLREHFAVQRQIHRNDETLSDLLMIRTSTYSRDATRRVFELTEAVIQHLVDAGFSPDNALQTYNAASVFTRGIIIHGRILRLSNAPTLDARQRRMTDWSTMPLLESMLDRHALAGTDDADFDFGLARLVCGFEALLAEQDVAATTRTRAAKAAPKKASKAAKTKPASETPARSAVD